MLKNTFALALAFAGLTACYAHRGGQTTAHTTIKAEGDVIAVRTHTTIMVDDAGKTTKTTVIDSTVMTAAGGEHDLKKDEVKGNTKVGVAEAKNRQPCCGSYGMYPGQYGQYSGYGYSGSNGYFAPWAVGGNSRMATGADLRRSYPVLPPQE